MKPEELAAEVGQTVRLAQERIKGIGAEQYAQPDGTQKFETMNLDDLLQMAEEEALDLINYAVMMRIRFARWRRQLEKVEVLNNPEEIIIRIGVAQWAKLPGSLIHDLKTWGEILTKERM